ncbi:hypothetical protein ASE51_22715 [Bacillus sp. Root147]|nr:hypothetical protein ASE51_22715 [Bacillus sp. Root147]
MSKAISITNIVLGVVVKTKFITSHHKAFQQYVEYVDRDEAKQEDRSVGHSFSLYQDYMGDPNKTSSLFTHKYNRLTEEQKAELKESFEEAQKNNSRLFHIKRDLNTKRRN